jgi:hypothetical protein
MIWSLIGSNDVESEEEACIVEPSCTVSFNDTACVGCNQPYVFQTSSSTQSIDVSLSSNSGELQLSLVDYLENPIVCDPVCGSTTPFSALRQISYDFISPDYYAIDVFNFGSSVASYTVNVTITGDQAVCDWFGPR